MENTAKNFALQLGSLISLYISITALITLLFGIITIQYPDASMGYWEAESAASSIRFTFALLSVFFPVYIVLTRSVNQIRRIEHGTYLTLTKWLIYLSLLVGGGVLLGDLVSLLNSFLNGEITTRFLLKTFVILAVVGLACTYYVLDAKGYWQKHELRSKQYAFGASILVIIALVGGYLNIKKPSEVREINIDKLQISDLQNIQVHVGSYYQLHASLPVSITESYGDIKAPQASENRKPYTLEVTSTSTFKLCAEFKFDSSNFDQGVYASPMYIDEQGIKNASNWDYIAGFSCFERGISDIQTLK